MALTRKWLSALGIESDKIDEIISAHSESISAIKEERDNFKAEAEKLAKSQKDLTDANEEMKNKNNSDYESLKKEFEDYKLNIENEKSASAKKEAYKNLLKDAGISEKRIDTILKVTNIDDIKLNKDGKITDSERVSENIKNEWSDFIVTESISKATTATPPTNTSTSAFDAMSLSEKMAYANANPNNSDVVSWLNNK